MPTHFWNKGRFSPPFMVLRHFRLVKMPFSPLILDDVVLFWIFRGAKLPIGSEIVANS
jgi:hypothetical protein